MADPPNPTHFAFPFRWSTTRHAVENDQDTPEDIADCVVASVLTPKGWRTDQEDSGISDPTFSVPVNVTLLISELDDDEPRARTTLSSMEIGEDITRDEFLTRIQLAI